MSTVRRFRRYEEIKICVVDYQDKKITEQIYNAMARKMWMT